MASEGTKIVLYDSFSYYQNDFAIGIEPYNMFFTVAEAAANGFKFYGNTTCCTSITGTGDITTNGFMKAATAQTTGNSTVGGDLTVTGSLITSSFYSMKADVGIYVVSNALSTTVKTGCATAAVSRSNTGIYVFTCPAHLSGAN